MTNPFTEDNLNGKVLLLKLFQDKAFLSVNKQLSTKSLKYHSYLKYFKEPSYWILKVLNHDTTEKKIHVSVLEYQVGDKSFPVEQIALNYLLDQIEFITFNAIDTLGLVHTGSVKISKLQPSPSIPKDIGDRSLNSLHTGHVSEFNEETITVQGPHITTEIIKVKILDTTFVDNGVQCNYKHARQENFIDFTVTNHTIKKEFEAIKSYFIKALGTRHFTIELTISEDSGTTTIIKALSKEIDRIDTSIIENVKFDFIKTNLHRHRNTNGESGFTDLDKLKEIKTDQNVIIALPIDSNELIDKVMQITKAKHYKNLKYLSKLHKSNIMKLRYLLKPFSFLFLLEGKEKYIFIWETLKTKEASYLWKIEKNPQKAREMFNQIEQYIKNIKDSGKLKYLAENSDNCTRIYHDYSDPDIGFLEWTKEIEKHIMIL